METRDHVILLALASFLFRLPGGIVALPLAAQTFPESPAERILAESQARWEAWEQEKLMAEWLAEQRFLERARRFVELWNQFAVKYSRGELDVELAHQVSEAFHRLEASDRWPAKKQRKRSACTATPDPE